MGSMFASGMDAAMLMDHTATNFQPDLSGNAELPQQLQQQQQAMQQLQQQQSMMHQQLQQQQSLQQQLQGGSSMPAGGLTALLAEDDGPQASNAAQTPAAVQHAHSAPGVVDTPGNEG